MLRHLPLQNMSHCPLELSLFRCFPRTNTEHILPEKNNLFAPSFIIVFLKPEPISIISVTRDIFSFYYLSLFRLSISKSKKSPTSHFFCSGVINDDSSFYDKLFQAIRMIKSFKTPLFSGVFHLPT